jgi:hypothetical protein
MSQENLPVKQEAGGNGALTPSAAFSADSPRQAASAPKTRRERKPAPVREHEARLLIDELNQGSTRREICEKFEWSARTYWRRVSLAKQRVREQYDPEQMHMVLAAQERTWRTVQGAVMRQADALLLSLDRFPRDAESAHKRAALISVLLRALMCVGECGKEIIACAQRTGIIPPRDALRTVEKARSAIAALSGISMGGKGDDHATAEFAEGALARFTLAGFSGGRNALAPRTAAEDAALPGKPRRARPKGAIRREERGGRHGKSVPQRAIVARSRSRKMSRARSNRKCAKRPVCHRAP